jgi:hypothetical protein
MSAGVLLQYLVAGVLVAGCAWFSAWRLASVALRLRMIDGLKVLPLIGSAGWLERLKARTLARSAAACGGCSSSKPSAVSRNQTPGALRR